MRKWSPEPFAATIETPVPAFEEWAVERPALRDDFHQAFEPETESSEEDEREAIRREAREEFQQRAADLQAEYTRRLEEARTEFTASVASWRDHWNELQERRTRRLAEDAKEMAILMAEKIIRARATCDRDMLLRSLETALFKIRTASEVTVLVHPDDALWLELDEESRERLRIGAVVPDRRVDRGGCRIKAEGAEWDATVRSQLATLADVLTDALAEPEEEEEPRDED